MPDEHTIQTLNKLLDAEYTSLAQRLSEACPYADSSASDDWALVRRLVDASRSHQRDLVKLISRLRGTPVAPRRATDTAGMHYVALTHLMPEILASLREMVSAYESAEPSGDSEADALVARFLAAHRRHLDEFEKRRHANTADC